MSRQDPHQEVAGSSQALTALLVFCPLATMLSVSAIISHASVQGGMGFGSRSSGGSMLMAPSSIRLVEVRWRVSQDPVVDIGGGSGADSDLFRVTGALRLDDGRIVVIDGGQRLMFFDQRGVWVQTVGRRGGGPGEFQGLEWIDVLQPDSLVVYDARLARASVFTEEGTFQRTISPSAPPGRSASPAFFGVLADGSFLARSRLRAAPLRGGAGLVRPNLMITHHDRSGAFLDSLFVVPGDEIAVIQGVLAQSPYARRTQFAVGPAEFYVATSDEFKITAYRPNGRVVRTVTRPYRAIPVTQADVRAVTPAGGLEIPAPSTFPVISSLLVDDAGRLWVNPFKKRSGDEVAVWSVFGASGELVADAEMPSRFSPTHIGDDLVVGVWLDSLDVEHVQVRTLLRP